MEDKAFENWEAKKAHLMSNYPEINKDDLIYKAGQEVQILETLQKKLKKSKQEVQTLLTYIGYR